MKTVALIPVEEYLRTAYSPDRDYVDGEVQERNLGELDHSDLQGELIHFFRARKKSLKVHAFPEQRDLKFGVPYVWVINPVDQRAWACTQDGNAEIRDGVLRTENPSLEVPLAQVFAEL